MTELCDSYGHGKIGIVTLMPATLSAVWFGLWTIADMRDDVRMTPNGLVIQGTKERSRKRSEAKRCVVLCLEVLEADTAK